MTPKFCPPLWQFWNNPLVRRYATARLRLLSVVGWSVIVQALAAFIWLATYFATKHTLDVRHAALTAWGPILVLQGLLWLMKGTFSVAVGIAREGTEGLSESQRLTPLSAWHKVIGYLCGLPILETVLVASLLPWSAVSIIVGKVPLMVVFRVHLLLVTAAVLHHAIGLVAGTVIRQKIVAGTVSQLIVITLHFIVPIFARFGLGPLGHLGVGTALASELLPLEGKSSSFAKVRFFDFDLALTGYQWVVMAILSGFLLQILWRRWKRADAHLLSKPLALAFSAWIIVMSMGEIFPLLRDGTLFDWSNKVVKEHSAGDRMLVAAMSHGFIPLGWAGVFGCVALLSTMVLAAIITPTLEQYGRARRVHRNTPLTRLSWASDARSALVWVCGLGLMALAGWFVLVKQLLNGTALLHLVIQPRAEMPFVLGLGLLIPLLTWTVLLEWQGLKLACLGAFVFWIIPVMAGIVGVLSGTEPTHWPMWWVGFSGFVLPLYSMSQSVSGLVNFSGVLHQIRMPWLISLTAHAVLAVVMFGCLIRARRLNAQ